MHKRSSVNLGEWFGKLRHRAWEVLEVAKPGDRLSRGFDIFILSLIGLNVFAAVVGTVGWVHAGYGQIGRAHV